MEHIRFWAIGMGILVGTLARILLLKNDYRNYPSFPNGYLIHITIGFIAAALGSVAVPALLNEDFVAVTFLALAIQQFREVRRMEKESLLELEDTELVPRGRAYIDGLAKSFESRNYVVLLTSLVTSSVILFVPTSLQLKLALGVVVGFSVKYVIFNITQNDMIAQIAHVQIKPLRFEGDSLYVGDIYLTNVGLEKQKRQVLEQGLGIILVPRDKRSEITLANYGLRQAVVHEVGRVLGIKRFYGTRREFATGRIGMYVVLIHKDEKALLRVIENVPLLETVRRKHLA